MIDNITHVNQKYISKYKAAEFDLDIKRWKSALKHMENELIFINRLLASDTHNARTVNSSERLNTFKKQIKTKTAILKDFEIEVSQYNHELSTTEFSDSDITDDSWVEKHDSLIHRFEAFRKDFNAFRLNVLKYT